jgi:hypothetical protein
LLADQENTLPTYHPKIKIAQLEAINKKDMLKRIDSLLNNLYNLSKREVVECCKDFVPEFYTNNVNYIKEKEQVEIPVQVRSSF